MAARLHLDTMQRRNGWPLQAESMALRILGHLSQLSDTIVVDPSEVVFGSQDYPEIGMALRRAMEFISANSHQPLSLADVAAAQKTSANYLSRLFRSQAKTSFSHFLTQLRLVRAADQLRESPRTTVLSIALDTGFPNIAAFNTAFRRTFGTTPTQWRKSIAPQLTRFGYYTVASDYEDIDKLSDLASCLLRAASPIAT
jgi:AraC-like DNA-binding protein